MGSTIKIGNYSLPPNTNYSHITHEQLTEWLDAARVPDRLRGTQNQSKVHGFRPLNYVPTPPPPGFNYAWAPSGYSSPVISRSPSPTLTNVSPLSYGHFGSDTESVRCSSPGTPGRRGSTLASTNSPVGSYRALSPENSQRSDVFSMGLVTPPDSRRGSVPGNENSSTGTDSIFGSEGVVDLGRF
jgi:hypothetical protein